MEPVFDTTYFEKIKINLQSESKNTRRKCLDELHTILQYTTCEFEFVDTLEVFKMVMKVFIDKSETCRERAINIATSCVKQWDIPEEQIMFYVLPSIHKRLVVEVEIEPAEEIRLCLIKLLNAIVDKYGANLGPHLKDVVDMLIRCICDEYPELKKESCICACNLARRVPEFRLHSEDVLKAVLKILKHKHSKIRITAINSLRDIVQFGRSDSVEMVCGTLGESLIDENAQVRLAVLRVAAFWFANLRDRYSYFCYLLPLVLTELTDNNSLENIEEAQRLWHEIGLQYLRENEDTLKEKQELLPTKLEHYPPDRKRPNLGCRTIVQNEMMKIIPTVMLELQDWQSEVRIKSSELLKVIVLHGEDRIISFLDVALPTMCKACVDEEVTVCKNVTESAELMGYFVTSDMYWKLIITKIKENRSLGQYVVLAALLKYNIKSSLVDRISEIITDLIDSEIRETREERCQDCLLKIVSKLLTCVDAGSLNVDSVHELYLILVSVMAFGRDETDRRASELLEELAGISSNSSVSQLNELCLPRLFARFSASCTLWESYSVDFNIFLILLSAYTNDVLKYVTDDLLKLLHIVLNRKADREVVFKTLQHFGKLLENDKLDFINNVEILEKIIVGPLKPQLIWNAGKVVEVVRCTAAGIVLLYVQKSFTLTPEFIRDLHPLVLGLCEDGYDDTRIYSLLILPFLGLNVDGIIETDIFVKSFNAASERLNDKSNVVRLNAIKSAQDLLLRAPHFGIYENEEKMNILRGLRILFLNADDEDKKIRNRITDIMKYESITANMKTIVCENELQNFIDKCRNPDVSDLLRKYLNI